jgi:energy-coupling factor transporter transmembrane protein EcfT
MRKRFIKYYFFLENLFKYISIFIILIFKNRTNKMNTKAYFFIKEIMFYILFFLLFIAIIHYSYDYIYSVKNTINISCDNEYNHYNMLNIFNNKPYYHFPSYFTNYEFLNTNFTFKLLNCNVNKEMYAETENYFLLKQSYLLSEMYKSNNEIINNLSNLK